MGIAYVQSQRNWQQKKNLRDSCNSEKIRKKLENIMVNNITYIYSNKYMFYNDIKGEVLI